MEASLKEINDVAAKLALQLEGNREVTRQITEKAKLLQAAQQRLQSITAENQQRKITFEWSEQQSELAGRVDELTEENATLAEMIKEYQHTLDTLMAKHKSLSVRLCRGPCDTARSRMVRPLTGELEGGAARDPAAH